MEFGIWRNQTIEKPEVQENTESLSRPFPARFGGLVGLKPAPQGCGD